MKYGSKIAYYAMNQVLHGSSFAMENIYRFDLASARHGQ
jgi:hypothetical protein